MKLSDLNLDLDFQPDRKTVESNRIAIDEAIKGHERLIAHLRSLHSVNQSVCVHPEKRDVYDPGYAGGGQDGCRCLTCGRRGYF